MNQSGNRSCRFYRVCSLKEKTISPLTGSHSLEAGRGPHRPVSPCLISSLNGCHLSRFGLQWRVFSGLKSRKKKTHVVLLLSQGSICSQPQQDCWLKDICQGFGVCLFFYLFNNDFLNSQRSSITAFQRHLCLISSAPWLNGRAFASQVLTSSQTVGWCHQLIDHLLTGMKSRDLELFRSYFCPHM